MFCLTRSRPGRTVWPPEPILAGEAAPCGFSGPHGQIPRLAGQDLAYLRKLLRAFKEKTASDLDGLMTMSAQPISEEDIEILSQYAASLGDYPTRNDTGHVL